MLKRQEVIEVIAQVACDKIKIISCLGRISRDLYAMVPRSFHKHCFFNMGSMGSVLPFSLGLAIASRKFQFVAVEGDGSVLMNMGALVTYKRYKTHNLILCILDNKQHETTGGQKSQPDTFDLSHVIASMGHNVLLIQTKKELNLLASILKTNVNQYDIIIIRSSRDKISPRIKKKPNAISMQFRKALSL